MIFRQFFQLLAMDSSDYDSQVDFSVNAGELEDGLHKIIDGGSTDGLRYFTTMVHAQEMKLEAQYQSLKHRALRNGSVWRPETDVKVFNAIHQLEEIEQEAKEALRDECERRARCGSCSSDCHELFLA